MESMNIVTMCRLCLCENECLVNIFVVNDWQGYVAAEVISNLLNCQVSETDGYPHVVCSTCLTKLTDFKLFKEFCQKSKETYDRMFVPSDSLVKHRPEMVEFVAVKKEPMCYSDKEDNVSKEKNGFDVTEEDNSDEKGSVEEINDHGVTDGDEFKEEPVEDICDGVSDSKLCEKDPLGERSLDVEFVAIKSEPVHYLEKENNFTKVQHTAVDMVTHSHYLQSLEHDTPISTSKEGVGAHLCTRNITTNDESIFENSKNISLNVNIEASSSERMEKLEGQWISSEERMHIAPFIQDHVVVNLEVDGGKKEKDMGGEMEEGTGAAPKKGLEGERKLLECFHCGSMFTTKKSLVQHMNLHGFTYDCNICGKEFNSKYGLKRHALVHADSTPYKCEECSKCFTQICHLKKHMRVHTGSKPYKCAECSKCFSESGNLTQHKRIHSGSKPYKCADCSKCFAQNCYLKKHMKLHRGPKPYECAECSASFTDDHKFKIHTRFHRGPKLYKCSECSKCFSDNSNLKRHIRSHTGYKPYKCVECSKCFTQNSGLKKHMTLHSGLKPYKCTQCGKSFRNNSNLKKHMRSHTGSKPHKCVECSKCFNENGDLKVHMRIHTGCKPFKCGTCSKEFAISSNLKRHFLVHTMVKP